MHKTLALVGGLLTIVGAVSYGLLLDVPWIRSKAIPCYLLIAVGLLLCLFALREKRSALTISATVVSLLVGGAFVAMLNVMTRLPVAESAPVVGSVAPAFVLADQNGKDVSLDSLTSQGPVLLVFYRGFW